MTHTDARRVADWFLWRAAQENPPRLITNLKLQKLVYYAQAWHLALSGTPLFEDKIEAWVHGPVVRELYFDHRESGWNPIAVKFDNEPDVDGDTREHLEETWDVYGGYDARYLEMLTHREAPWQLAREGLDAGTGSDREVTQESMRTFYQGVKQRLESDVPF